MSLFKARDWWSTVLGEKEEFDQGCLCLADVDNSGNGQGKDFVGALLFPRGWGLNWGLTLAKEVFRYWVIDCISPGANL